MAANRKDSTVNNQLQSTFLGAEREARKGFTAKQPKQIADKTEHPKSTGEGMERVLHLDPESGLKRIRKQGAMGSHGQFLPSGVASDLSFQNANSDSTIQTNGREIWRASAVIQGMNKNKGTKPYQSDAGQ